jgi:threonylcarbamoyladenosine tRNA methylthiotransferase MtaB
VLIFSLVFLSLSVSTFFIQQFGCRATQADGAALERQLLDRGCTPAADPSLASIVILNTCTVTAAADAQTRDAIRKVHSQNPSARLIVTGCYAQRAPEELAALPGVSYVVGNSHKPQIPDLINANSAGHVGAQFIALSSGNQGFSAPSPLGAQHVSPHLGTQLNAERSPAFSSNPLARPSSAFFPTAAPLRATENGNVIPSEARNLLYARPPAAANLQFAPILTGDIFAHTELLSAPLLGGESNHTRPTLKIQDGCNLRCSYCVIPFVRGKSRSLPPDAVLREIQSLISSDSAHQTREIVLSGINLGTYGRDLTPRTTLLSLLRRILDETSLDRLRLSSIEPQDLTQDFIDLFASTDRLAQHFHMPLQSGSDRILAAMHRWYRTEHYARRVELIRERLPHAAIGADVIAGFPGESDSDHETTLAFIERLPFTYLHVFSFSARPGTPAAFLPNQVPAHIIKRRARQLRALGEVKSAAFRHSQLGRTLRVLTLRRGPNAPADTTPALASNYLKLSVSGDYDPNRWLEIQLSHENFATLPAGAIADPVPSTSI